VNLSIRKKIKKSRIKEKVKVNIMKNMTKLKLINLLKVSGGGGGGTVAWNDVTGKPTFATVATSGDYTDLINTPTIPAAPVQTDWSEYDSSSLAYLANRPSWVRNTQQWTLEDDQQVSKGIPMVITNNYQWGLGVNEIIAPAYNRTATTDLLTVKTTNSNGDTITDTIMHVGTNGVYAPTFYENNVSLANKYIAQGGVTDVWTGTQSQYDNLGSYSSTTLYLITAS
jgi:hypothetical protein